MALLQNSSTAKICAVICLLGLIMVTDFNGHCEASVLRESKTEENNELQVTAESTEGDARLDGQKTFFTFPFPPLTFPPFVPNTPQEAPAAPQVPNTPPNPTFPGFPLPPFNFPGGVPFPRFNFPGGVPLPPFNIPGLPPFNFPGVPFLPPAQSKK